jgi:hypothetical protein
LLERSAPRFLPHVVMLLESKSGTSERVHLHQTKLLQFNK